MFAYCALRLNVFLRLQYIADIQKGAIVTHMRAGNTYVEYWKGGY